MSVYLLHTALDPNPAGSEEVPSGEKPPIDQSLQQEKYAYNLIVPPIQKGRKYLSAVCGWKRPDLASVSQPHADRPPVLQIREAQHMSRLSHRRPIPRYPRPVAERGTPIR